MTHKKYLFMMEIFLKALRIMYLSPSWKRTGSLKSLIFVKMADNDTDVDIYLDLHHVYFNSDNTNY